MPRTDSTGRSGPRPGMARGGALSHAYTGLRELIFSYDIKPEDRLVEGDLARRLGVSRTPVREALNRLVMENLLRFEPTVGYYRPRIDVGEIVDLYELRLILETEGLRLALRRATADEIRGLMAEWAEVDVCAEGLSRNERIAADERFHERLVGLGRNAELVAALRRLNARIHFVRWAPSRDDHDHRKSHARHGELLEIMLTGDEERAVASLRALIERRREDLVGILREGAARLFVS